VSVVGLMTRPIQVFHRVPIGEDQATGQPVYEDQVTSLLGYVYQKRTGDRDSSNNTIEVTWENQWLALPPETQVESIDAVSIGGTEYEVVGEPHFNWNPRKAEVEFVELEIRRAAA